MSHQPESQTNIGPTAGWTHQKPTVPGAYWIRGNHLLADALIQVIDDNGVLRCNLHQTTTETDFSYGYTIEQLHPAFEYLGPLVPSQSFVSDKAARTILANANAHFALALEDEDKGFRAMLSAHSLCPHGLSHTESMRWMADHFLKTMAGA